MLLPILTLSLAGVAALWCLQQKKRRLRDIQDEVVVIIGASSGVGLETARLYARSWTDHPRRVLHVVARRREIEDVKDEISRTTGCEHIYAHVSDASSAEDIAALAENLRQRSGKIDTLIYCAGALTTRSFVDLSSTSAKTSARSQEDRDLRPSSAEARVDPVIAVAQASYNANVLSCMNTINNLLPLLKLSSRPQIAVLSSVAAEIPAPTRSIYAAHKAALSMFLRCLRIELDSVPVGTGPYGRGQGIGISIIHPASINTGLRGKSLDAVGSATDITGTFSGVQKHEKNAMSAEYVAEQVKKAVELEIDEMWLPGLYWWVAKVFMVIAPGFIARKAKKKYNWSEGR